MPTSDWGRVLLASLVTLVAAFVFLFPIGSRTETVRCPNETGCLQEQYRSLFTTAFIAAQVEGPLDHLNVLTVGVGILGTAATAAAAYRLSSPQRDVPTR